MQAFNIKESIVRPFDKLSANEFGNTVKAGTLVQNFVASNLPCGNVNFGNMNTIFGSVDRDIKDALRSVASVAAVIDGCIMAGFAIAKKVAQVMDFAVELGEKIANLDIGAELDKLDLKLTNLGLNIAAGIAKGITDLVTKITDGIKDIVSSVTKALSNFSIGKIIDKFTDGLLDLSFDIGDAFADIVEMLECQAESVLGMLSMGMSGLAALTNTSFNFASPLNGVMGAINGAVSGVMGVANGVLGTVNGAISTVNGLVPGPLKAIIGGINPIAGMYLGANGVSSIINTAFGDTMSNSFKNKSLGACLAAQKLNRFGNYDPFISTAMSVSGLTAANVAAAAIKYGIPAALKNDDCKCCTSYATFTAKDAMANMLSSTYDRRSTYHAATDTRKTLPNYVDPFISTRNELSDDYASEVIAQYGFSDDNVLNMNLGTNLEIARATSKMSGNMSELQLDGSKINSFLSETQQSLRYVASLNEKNLQNNLCLAEDLKVSMRELDASKLSNNFEIETIDGNEFVTVA